MKTNKSLATNIATIIAILAMAALIYFNVKPATPHEEPMPQTSSTYTEESAEKSIIQVKGNEINSPEKTEISVDEVIRLINEERINLGLQRVSFNYDLAKLAQWKSEDMSFHNNFSHKSSNGLDTWDEEANTYKYLRMGEILAVQFNNSQDQHTGWMNSPTHQEVIVNPEYSEIGVGISIGEHNGTPQIYTAVIFGRPSL